MADGLIYRSVCRVCTEASANFLLTYRCVLQLRSLVTAIFCCILQLCSLVTNTSCSPGYYPPPNNGSGVDVPPPLPSRKSLSMQSLSPPPLPPRPPPVTNTHNTTQLELDRHLLTHLTSSTVSHGIPNSVSNLIARYRHVNIYFISVLH